MFARAAARAVPKTPSTVARRGFQTTRAQMSSPYHYPEGPYTNIPFNPKSKFFGLGFWTYSFVGFFAPFGIAGACFLPWLRIPPISSTDEIYSLANQEAQGLRALFAQFFLSRSPL